MSSTEPPFIHEEYVRVGIVQTVINHAVAWKNGPPMCEIEQENARKEILKALNAFYEMPLEERPQIILFPELSTPRALQNELKNAANEMGCVIIAGLDYQAVQGGPPKKVRNQAIVIIPAGKGSERVNRTSTFRMIGKTSPAPGEATQLRKAGYDLIRDPSLWIFDAHKLGKFGVAICYDFLDLERAAMYRQKVQHMFVLAYNRDATSFYHVAEALSRMVFCNVIVCNTGFHGGSLAVSPFYDPWLRTLYRHDGLNLFAYQLIKLPVKVVYDKQNGVNDTSPKLKSLPPGYEGDKISLIEKSEKVLS